MNTSSLVLRNTLYFLIVFLLFFIPSSNFLGGFQVWYVFLTLLLLFLGVRISVVDYLNVRNVIFYCFCSVFFYTIAILMSGYGDGSLQDFNEFIRYLGVIGIFLFSYKYYKIDYSQQLVYFLKLFLIVQLIFCFLQSFSTFNYYLGFIWNTERVWDLRRTGTFSNPNILSIFSLVAYSYLFFKESFKKKILYSFITFGIILFTSSKTGLISFILILAVNYFLVKAKFSFKNILIFLIVLSIGVYSFVQLLYLFQGSYPYIAQILNMFDNDMDVSKIKSIGDRQVMWNSAFTYYEKAGFLEKVFGLGPLKETSLNVMDNEFLTILIKMGYIGCFIHLLNLGILVLFLLKNRYYSISKTMLSIVILFLVSSSSAATFNAWHLSLLFFFFLGISFKEIHLIKTKN